MKTAGIGVEIYQESESDFCLSWEEVEAIYKAMYAKTPTPEHGRMTKEEAQAFQSFQYWKGMDGAIAWSLIERHADGWEQVGMMMDAWLEANKT